MDTCTSTSTTPPTAFRGSEDERAEQQRKRNRIRFSCTTCREKKLKCNRQSPCDQCIKRNVASTCNFIPYAQNEPRPSPSASGATPGSGSGSSRNRRGPLQDMTAAARLRHLEHMVQVLKAQVRREESGGTDVPASSRGISPAPPSPSVGSMSQETEPDAESTAKGTAGAMADPTRYVEVIHWEAVLDEITTLTRNLKASDESSEDEEEEPSNVSGRQPVSVLFAGGFAPVPLADMFRRLPPKPVCDRLLNIFFEVKDPSWSIYHLPTLWKYYNALWQEGAEYSYVDLAFFFLLFANSAVFCSHTGEAVPGNLGSPMQAYSMFKTIGAHALALSDYSTPGKCKLEAMCMYFCAEFIGQPDAPLSTSIIFSNMVRLSMHMGLHRDPKHYPNMSPFEGEMRRRLWLLFVEVDQIVSFQFGLPSNIHSRFYDTEMPRNLRDEDFDESTKELPPSRPETEVTPILLNIVKSRMIRAFGDITAAMCSRNPISYVEVIRLDKQLEDAHNSLPLLLKFRSFAESKEDSVDVVMQRFWMELMYQKARIVLHRRYMGIGRTDKRYTHSQQVCLDAATKTLRCQYDVHCESQPGGRLTQEKNGQFFRASITTHDFLLAGMILCLELSYIKAREKRETSPFGARSDTVENDVISKDQLMRMLETSRQIWQSTRKQSIEANRAFKILSKMLCVSTGAVFESSPESPGSAYDSFQASSMPKAEPGSGAAATGTNPYYYTQPQAPTAMKQAVPVAIPIVMPQTTMPMPEQMQYPPAWQPDLPPPMGPVDFSPYNTMDQFMDPSLTADWHLWDNQVQNANVDELQIPWNMFFHPRMPGYQ
ncbi:hypothetical protein QBC32DRAFT_386472 [Pseudoneurospora amorphoporcata]|uniref:Zn(2)-C6 fungal-type domain-containing protein n=1 Tax=Pseudoneurospora amorphoporcata TaxID=241081 RepID=A0AAN6SGU0_9PEZI|nr:hypothetical protein QBC32DRAFT_386472 [Pseudoneurospora amorphoporcata]